MKSHRTTVTFSGSGGQKRDKDYIAGKLSETLKGVRERFFARKTSAKEKKLTPLQERQRSGGV